MTAFVSSPATNKKPTGDRSPMGCVGSPSSQHSLMTAAAAKIEMKPRQADVSAAATVTGAMAGAVPAAMTRTRTAAMADRAVAIHRMTVAVVACDSAFAIHRRSAGTAVVRETATGTVSIKSLRRVRTEDGETGSDSQESDEFFHDALGYGLSRCRQRAACQSDAAPMQLFSSTIFFHPFDL